jgi:hypothetical protein
VQALRFFAVIIVMAVWCGLYGRAIFGTGFDAPPEVSGLMLFVVTYLLGEPLGRNAKAAFLRRGQRVLDALNDDEQLSEVSDPPVSSPPNNPQPPKNTKKPPRKKDHDERPD